MRRSIALAAATPLTAIGLAACVGQASFRESAERFIEDAEREVATGLGVTFEEAVCEEPVNDDVGTTFNCTADGSDGLTYSFTASITGDRTFEIRESAEPTQGTVAASTVPGTATPTTVAGTSPVGTAPAGTAPPSAAPPTTG